MPIRSRSKLERQTVECVSSYIHEGIVKDHPSTVDWYELGTYRAMDGVLDRGPIIIISKVGEVG